MIARLTQTPSIDRTVEVARLERGEVIRARTTRVDAGQGCQGGRDLIEPLSVLGARVTVDASRPSLALALTAGPHRAAGWPPVRRVSHAARSAPVTRCWPDTSASPAVAWAALVDAVAYGTAAAGS